MPVTEDVGARDLPLILAGPILRRVEAGRVVVWLATSRPAGVRAEIHRVGRDGELLGAGTAESLDIGPRLSVHLAVVAPRAGAFPTGELLAYDVEVTPEPTAGGLRLADLGLLDGPAAIAYPGLPLPTFLLGPADDTSLGVLHGSCRLLHGAGEDAMRCADELLAASARHVATRPRALFLTGDQIYADDVAGPLAGHLRQLATELMGPADERSVPGCPPLSQVPVNGRRELAADRARLTGPKVDDHLLSFGEFAAMYLTAWNERTWPVRLPPAAETLGGARSPRSLRARRKYDEQRRNLERARTALPMTRRVLANVPTYMIFDDHDVTDDWNLTREWHDAVSTSPTGRRFVANALAAYWLFQGWGNDPDGDDEALAQTVAAFLRGDGSISGAEFEDRMWSFDRWSYVAPTSPPTVVLDTRTQRSYDSERGAARLLGPAERQRTAELARRAREIGGDPQHPLVLISAVPVYGLELQERRQKFLADKVGPYEIDFEAWHSNLQGLVDFMRMLAEQPAPPWCLLLSGDVHYGCNVQAAFSTSGYDLPLVQLVSSSFKHSGTLSRTALELLGRIVSRRHERLGWDRPPPIRRRLASRVVAKAANTDAWNPEAPVFLAPTLGRALGVERPPDYRETRRYVAPAGDTSGSMLLGTNNIGHVTIRDGRVTHRLFTRTRSGTRVHEATMATGAQVLAALERPPSPTRWRPGRSAHQALAALFGALDRG